MSTATPTRPDPVAGVTGGSATVPPGATSGVRRLRRRNRRRRATSVALGCLGFALLVLVWWTTTEALELPRFRALPGPVEVFTEWTSRDPDYGTSLFTSSYYTHIGVSVRRVAIAFGLATALGVPLGLALGWSRRVHDHVFPVFELIRPIPILAWVPLAILMFRGTEPPVIFLTFLAAFYATTLNTMLGVRSIDPNLLRAARCLGARPATVLRTVVVPGALPYVFTGLQLAMGVAWFSLVAGEMLSGRYGLGYLINSSYTTTRYPTIVIAMITLGVVGFASSAAIRVVGRHLMSYRVGGTG